MSKVKLFWVVWLGLGVVASAVLLWLRPSSYIFAGPSMQPTIVHDQRVVAWHSNYLVFGPPDVARGDVVVLRSPADGVDIIKRVVAIGGETVEWNDEGRLVLNGDVVPVEDVDCPNGAGEEWPEHCWRETIEGVSWIVGAGAGWAPLARGPVEVPAGHVYVLGDHRDHSNDSTNPRIGPVAVEYLLGRIEL